MSQSSMPPSGKTLSLLSRFPAFYDTGEASHLHQLMAVLGAALEGVEADLVRVLRSHFVDTANNSGSQGFVHTRRGNLDQIFALYLEKLGGTSQLIQVNAQFQPGDVLELEVLVDRFVAPDPTDTLGQYLRQRFQTQSPEDFQQLARFHVRHAHLKVDQWSQPAHLVTQLVIGQDALTQYLRSQLSEVTQAALDRYDGSDAVPPDLLAGVTNDINRQLNQRQLAVAFRQRNQQLHLEQALQAALMVVTNSLAISPTRPLPPDSVPQSLARAIRKRLSLPLQTQIFQRQQRITQGQTTLNQPQLIAQLLPELQALLPQPEIYTHLLAVSQGQPVPPAPTEPVSLQLLPAVVSSLLQAASQVMTRLLAGPNSSLPTVDARLTYLESQTAATEPERQRHHRLLLEASYPYDVPASHIPPPEQAQSTLRKLLNEVVLPDPEFYSQQASFWQTLTLDSETQPLIDKQTSTGLDSSLLQRLNRLLLEAAFPTELLKSYVPYRERLRELIQVLQRGASTQQGIRDIVAANLGIFTDSEAAQKAREKIEIEEYLPELLNGSPVVVQPFTEGAAVGDLPRQFTLTNPNVEPTAVTLRLALDDNRQPPQSELAPLSQLTLVNAVTGAYFTYDSALQAGNRLSLLANGRLERNGEDRGVEALPVLVLPVGESVWYFTAQVGELPGRLNEAQFDFSRFDQAEGGRQAMTAEQAGNYRIGVAYDLVKLTPGTFLVKVPWDIPGFTDRFDDLNDHPRSQIPGIINRVRAAGVDFAIAYSKTFRELHRHQDWLTVEPAYRLPHPLYDSVATQMPESPPHFVEHHQIEDRNFDLRSEQKPYGAEGVEHRMGDRLLMSGLFDYTTFDSGNTFA